MMTNLSSTRLSNTRRFRLAGVSGLLLALALAPSVAAMSEKTVLAFDGKPITVQQAAYGDLDPLGTLADPRSSVLSLERTGAPGSLEIELVPETEGPEIERSFSLLYDRDSESLFVFWESLYRGSTALNLVARDKEGRWTEVVEISGNPFSPKTPPILVITHDELARDPSDPALRGRRSILHLVWSEDREGKPSLVYSPVVLENGVYLGPNAIYDLGDLVGGERAEQAPAPTPALLEALLVSAGSDGHSVVLAFANSRTRRLSTVRIEALSPELVSVADIARANITVVGHRPPLRTVQDVARANITVVGHRIHPGVRGFMMQSIEQGLSAAGAADGRIDAQVAASIVWEEIIRVGASVEDQGLLDEETLRQPQILEVLAREPDEERPEKSPLLQMRVVSNRPVPTMQNVSQTRMFVSPDGRDVIVSWLQGKRLWYVESKAEGWSEAQGFDIDRHLSLSAAYQLLERRVR